MLSRLRPLAHPDAVAVLTLLLLWLLFFWRLFTPIAADQASLAKGDFSGQFVAFAGYQFERMSRGEIPLWNPYNNGGLPFIADTQAAVFYLPRWITLGVSALAGGWSYNALQLEMAAHVLAYSWLMYLFVRRLTVSRPHSHLAALVASIVIAYGGYLTGYPPLQLAILEAATWFPLAALGILEATRERNLRWRMLALAGFGLGMSWLAGHPQTSWFMTYLLAAYFACRCHKAAIHWLGFLFGLVAFALTSFGVCAVTLLPGLEYLPQTVRDGLGFALKGNGFPVKDVAQFVFPGAVSLWSPLYIGLPALFFVAVAAARNRSESRFWLVAALIGLLHSLGENSFFYHLTYNLVPGLRYFRGQERAAFVVANCLAVLSGLGVLTATNWVNQFDRERALRWWRRFVVALVMVAIIAFILWMGDRPRWSEMLDISTRSAIVAVASLFVLSKLLDQPPRPVLKSALVALIVFELFSVNLDHVGNYDSVPHTEQLSMQAPALVQQVLQDENSGQPFRVDGFRGLQENNGSLYGVMDMRGISPLWLKGPNLLINADFVDNPLAWELFAVKYVFSGQQRLSVPTQIIGTGSDNHGDVWLHRLENPRPFARLYYEVDVVHNDQWALELMGDIRYHERDKIVVLRPPTLTLPNQASAGSANVISFAPEEIVIEIDTAENALLSLSLPHYPGWNARLNSEPVHILRAYASLSAVEIPAGRHTLVLTFAPDSYAVGALISACTWLGLALAALYGIVRRR